MIEIPRAALTADKLAEYTELFSFGTNDLTQTTYAISKVPMARLAAARAAIAAQQDEG